MDEAERERLNNEMSAEVAFSETLLLSGAYNGNKELEWLLAGVTGAETKGVVAPIHAHAFRVFMITAYRCGQKSFHSFYVN